MAITLESSPQSYYPAFNQQFWVASSNQTAQPNFRYRVVFTDLLSSESVTKDIDADPDGLCKFDSGGFIEQYMTREYPANQYGFANNSGAVRKLRVNIGEVYGATPTYYAGSNVDRIVWDAAINWLDTQDFVNSDFYYTQSPGISPKVNYTCNDIDPDMDYSNGSISYRRNEKTAEGHDSYVYCLSTAAGDFEKIEIVGFDSAGNQLSSTIVGNVSLSGSSSYQDKYYFINVGYNGLENMPVGFYISGTWPIPVSTFDTYLVRERSSWMTPPVPYTYRDIKTFEVICEPRYDIVSLHYLSPFGDMASKLFSKKSERRQDGKKSYYSKLPYAVTGSNPTRAVTFNKWDRIETTLTSSKTESITLNTDWLEEWEVTQLKDLFTSPVVYLSFGDGNPWIAVKVKNSSYAENRKYNSQLLSISFDVEYCHSDIRQKG